MHFDRYELIRTIASGGMGQVYEAIAHGHDGFERRVAIKRVLPELLGDPSSRKLFRDEALIASQLHHSNIVQVLDYGVVDGAEFLVMELADGVDAARAMRLAGAPFPPDLAVHIVTEIAHALAYAHELHIVHRDVSPHNILLSWQGDVKLSDFGIAVAQRRETRTETGVIKGKLAYLAPELRMAERPTAAADIWALGTTLHGLLRDRLPEDPVAGDEPELPAPITELVAHCRVHEPAGRPTAAEVARRAESLARGGRGALRERLAPLRDQVHRHSPLDDLMGMALVPVGPDRTFHVERTKRTAPERTHPTAATVATAPARRTRWLAGALTLIAGGGGAWYFATRVEPPASDARDVAGIDGGIAVAVASGVAVDASDVGIDAGAPAAVVDARSVIDAAIARDDAPRAIASPHIARDHTTSRPPIDAGIARDHTPPRAAIDAGIARGWIKIGGRLAVNADVTIDGRRVGLAPLELDLDVGSHHVVARDGSGAVVIDERIEIDEHDTRLNPARLLK